MRATLVERAAEERLDRQPGRAVRKRPPPRRRAAVGLLAHGHAERDALEPPGLLGGAGGAAGALVAGVDAEATALDGPDRQLVRRPRRTGLRGQGHVRDEVGAGGTLGN